jgi:site-specific DNA-methyltransferase (adenine-specific)
MSILTAQLLNKIISGEICRDRNEVNLKTIRFFSSELTKSASDQYSTGLNLLGRGDNLAILSALQQDQLHQDLFQTRNRIKLIYIDPPFATNKNFAHLQTRAYSDKVTGSSFLEFMACRLSLLHQILAEDGAIYVHIDWKYAHYVKLLLDLIFGVDNFKNEIIWHFQSGGRTRNFFARKHASIFYYVKSAKTPFYGDAVAVSRGHAKKNNLKKEVDAQGRTFWSIKSNGKSYKYYADFQQIPDDVWNDIPHLQQHDPQRKLTSNYPTQKPEKLLERIIKASSQPGDIVLDAFAGSGTTVAVAHKLQRRWIGIDQSKLSLKTIKKRLFNLTDQIGSTRIDKRREHERINDFTQHSLSRSRGLFLIYDKARKGELIVDDHFLKSLAAFLENHLKIKKKETFSLCCPQKKLQLQKYQLSRDKFQKAGNGNITIKKIKFLISFVQPRKSLPEPSSLGIPEFAEIQGVPTNNFPPAGYYLNFSKALVRFLTQNKNCKFSDPDGGYFSRNDYSGYIWPPDQIDNFTEKTIGQKLSKFQLNRIILIVPAWLNKLRQNKFYLHHKTITVIEIPAFIFNNLEQSEPIDYDDLLQNNLNKINLPPLYSRNFKLNNQHFNLEISNFQLLKFQTSSIDNYPEFISISPWSDLESDQEKIMKLIIPTKKLPKISTRNRHLLKDQPASDSGTIFPEFIPISGSDNKTTVKFKVHTTKPPSSKKLLLCLTDKYGNEAREPINLNSRNLSQS